MQIKFRKLSPGSVTPSYGTPGAAGLDLCACIPHTIYLQPGVRFKCPTGIAIELPEGFEAQVRPRSGLAANHGVTVLNAPGTVDADYRGEVMVILINHGDDPVTINTGDRIAQLVIAPVITASLVQASELSDTERGTGGFGSTGVA